MSQFLPQDKVASFAQMDPPKLLRETQRAASETMIDQHDDLIELQKKLKLLQTVFLNLV